MSRQSTATRPRPMTVRQAAYVIFRIHANACPRFASGQHCESCAELDSRARIADWRTAAAGA